jgi:hypothetical protein
MARKQSHQSYKCHNQENADEAGDHLYRWCGGVESRQRHAAMAERKRSHANKHPKQERNLQAAPLQ